MAHLIDDYVHPTDGGQFFGIMIPSRGHILVSAHQNCCEKMSVYIDDYNLDHFTYGDHKWLATLQVEDVRWNIKREREYRQDGQCACITMRCRQEYPELASHLPPVLAHVVNGYAPQEVYVDVYNVHNGYYPRLVEICWDGKVDRQRV